jgi:hypothetical protein
LNTVILLGSGASVTYAHHSLIQGSRAGTIAGLIVTIALAVVFTMLQGLEYHEAGFTIADGAYGSTFYFATGFHGLACSPSVKAENGQNCKKIFVCYACKKSCYYYSLILQSS